MTISIIQSIPWTGTGPGVSSSSPVTTTPGNAFLALGSIENPAFNAFVDSKSNTWLEVPSASPLVTGFGNELRAFYAVSGLGGTAHTFGIDTDSGSFPSAIVLEMSQADLASILDGTALAANDTSPPFSAGAFTPSAGNRLLISFISSNSGENPATYTPNGGFSLVDAITNGGAFWTCAVAARVVTSPAAYDPAWTGSAGVSSTGVMLLAIKESTGGAADQPPETEGWGWDDAGYADDAAVIESMVSSQPVTSSELAPQDDFDHFDVGLYYEEPTLDTFEWSNPLNPNAPPNALETEYWDWFEAFEDLDAANDSAPVGANAAAQADQPPEGNGYFDFETEVDEDFFDDFGNEDTDPEVFHDVWAWDDAGDDAELLAIIGSDEDPLVANGAPNPIEDPWEWTEDVHDPAPTDDYALIDGPAPLPALIEEQWNWEEAEDVADFSSDTPAVSDFPPEDAWDFSEFVDDAWTEDATLAADFVPPPSQFTDDSWDWSFDDIWQMEEAELYAVLAANGVARRPRVFRAPREQKVFKARPR